MLSATGWWIVAPVHATLLLARLARYGRTAALASFIERPGSRPEYMLAKVLVVRHIRMMLRVVGRNLSIPGEKISLSDLIGRTGHCSALTSMHSPHM